MNDISVPQQYELETAALKVPPHSIEAEQAVLGGLMLDNNAWERVLDQVSDGDFYRHDHRLIFRAIFTLAERNSPFDVVTLSEQLDKEGHLPQVGRSEEHTSELQSLMRISYAVFCLKKKKN